MQDLGVVPLVGHHGVDVLVGGRQLVDDAHILAALDAAGLLGEVARAVAAPGAS